MYTMKCDIFTWNRSFSANDSAYCYTFLCNVVCRLSVCHNHAPLNRLWI